MGIKGKVMTKKKRIERKQRKSYIGVSSVKVESAQGKYIKITFSCTARSCLHIIRHEAIRLLSNGVGKNLISRVIFIKFKSIKIQMST